MSQSDYPSEPSVSGSSVSGFADVPPKRAPDPAGQAPPPPPRTPAIEIPPLEQIPVQSPAQPRHPSVQSTSPAAASSPPPAPPTAPPQVASPALNGLSMATPEAPSQQPAAPDPATIPRPVPQQPSQVTNGSGSNDRSTGRALPPPPPPRSTLAPVRTAPEIPATVSGIGSAKAPRWRGELEDINRKAEAKEAARRAALLAAETGREAPPEAVPDAEEEDPETVAKSMPSWLVSTVMHLVLLLILALISSPAGSGIGRVLLELGFTEQKSDEVELAEFTIETPVEVGEELESNEVPIEVDVMQVFETVEAVSDAEVAPAIVGVGPQEFDIAVPMFNGRTGAMKKALLSIYGGTPETENAVALGLEWLAKNQRSDGSWSMRGPYADGATSENKSAATAMAMLAFLGDGNTHEGGKYKGNVEKGMKFLVRLQARDGFMAKDAHSHQRMYAQAQATIVLCELYGMTKDSWLRPKAQLAVEFAEQAQSPEGGWRYQPRFDSDTSVTGWFVMGLKSGESAGLDVNASVLRKVSGYLDTVSDFDEYSSGAGYAYQPGGRPSPAMTAEGLLCRQYLGWQRNHPPMRKGIEALMLDAPFSLRDADVYYWYYATQTLHHFGGAYWREWNNEMKVQLPKAQTKAGKERGSWSPQRDAWGQNAGRLYTTCLSIYCLEVYYRHMPLYKHDKEAAEN